MESFLAEYRQKKSDQRQYTKTSSASDIQAPSEATQSRHDRQQERKSSKAVEEGSEEGDGFCTPELPVGRELVINILSTWGDKFYVGLTGLEIFTALGEPAKIQDVSVLYRWGWARSPPNSVASSACMPVIGFNTISTKIRVD